MIGWKSRWYASKQEFADLLVEDQKIRDFVKKPQGQVRQAAVPGDRQDRDRADPRRGEGDPVFGPARHAHRPQGRAGRGAAEGAAEPDRPADQHQDRGDQPARDRRPTGGRGHRRAVGEAGQLPPHDEAGDGTDDGGRRQGDQDPAGRPAGRRGNVAPREADRRLDPAVARCGRRSTTASPRRKIAQGHIGVQVWINQGMYSEDETDGADAQTGQAPKKPKRTYKR